MHMYYQSVTIIHNNHVIQQSIIMSDNRYLLLQQHVLKAYSLQYVVCADWIPMALSEGCADVVLLLVGLWLSFPIILSSANDSSLNIMQHTTYSNNVRSIIDLQLRAIEGRGQMKTGDGSLVGLGEGEKDHHHCFQQSWGPGSQTSCYGNEIQTYSGTGQQVYVIECKKEALCEVTQVV